MAALAVQQRMGSRAEKAKDVLGKIRSELAIDGRTDYPIEPFALQRDAITDPNFKPVFQM